MSFAWVMKALGLSLFLTGSLSIADSLTANPSDPNLAQFLPENRQQTQGEYCARCAEEALSASLSRVNSTIPDIREALKKVAAEGLQIPHGVLLQSPTEN